MTGPMGSEELFRLIIGDETWNRLRQEGVTTLERNREQSVAAFKTYLQLIPQVTETAEQALKDRLIFGKNFCVERIEESDTDTFVRLLRIYCQSTTAQGVSQITTAVAKKLGDRDFERQLWEEQEFRKLAHDDVCGPVLDGLIRFDI